jgi:GT2 family glycosyltransferase
MMPIMDARSGDSVERQNSDAGDAASESVVIVILTWNQRDKTLRCLQSLSEAGCRLDRVVIWDNGSDDQTEQSVRARYPAVLYHRHEANLGVASGRNAAAQLAIETWRPGYLLFLDNDMRVEPGLVERLVNPFSDDPQLGQTEAKIRMADKPDRLNAAGGSEIRFVQGTIKPVGYGERDTGQYDTRRECLPNGGAMMVRSDVFAMLGGFASDFDPYGPEDLDFSLRARQAGYRGLYIPEAVVYHDHRRSVEGGGFSANYTMNKTRHWLLLLRRHASPLQRLGFYLWGAPSGVLRVLRREVLAGNFAALKGLAAGLRRGSKER